MSKVSLKNAKRFSIGLNMDVTLSEFEDFLKEYANALSSIYFSVPLGRKYYSRTELEDEIEGKEAEEKLLCMLEKMKAYNVRSELAVNTYDLKLADLEILAQYMEKHNIVPDEIVCMAEYGSFFKKRMPKAELKYSFNNTEMSIPECFDTIVVGKEFLRDISARHRIVESGKSLVLLLNNGCSFDCTYRCGDTLFCGSILEKNLQKNSVNYLYALQSFFPLELARLLATDPMAESYRFKISNRPLGTAFTKLVLDAYLSLGEVSDLIKDSVDNYGLFCVMYTLFAKRYELDYQEIERIKGELPV